jgi:UDP-N-acetylmuramoyl-L-alanyl-D-glutamate--2,6-diaminopimelate ligase
MYPFIGNLLYGKPSRKIKLIGITGTDGKSSSVIFTVKILKEAGYKVGYFSSVSYSDGEHEYPNTFKMTMPGRLFLQNFLKRLVDNGCEYAVLEVTSEGIQQKRHLYMDFDIVLLTNIQQEHIEDTVATRTTKELNHLFLKILRLVTIKKSQKQL